MFKLPIALFPQSHEFFSTLKIIFYWKMLVSGIITLVQLTLKVIFYYIKTGYPSLKVCSIFLLPFLLIFTLYNTTLFFLSEYLTAKEEITPPPSVPSILSAYLCSKLHCTAFISLHILTCGYSSFVCKLVLSLWASA